MGRARRAVLDLGRFALAWVLLSSPERLQRLSVRLLRRWVIVHEHSAVIEGEWCARCLLPAASRVDVSVGVMTTAGSLARGEVSCVRCEDCDAEPVR